jgi:hypothetical protein
MNSIETSRLILRPFTRDDLDRIAELMADPGFMSFSAAGAASREEAARFWSGMLERQTRNEPSQFASFGAMSSHSSAIAASSRKLSRRENRDLLSLHPSLGAASRPSARGGSRHAFALQLRA